MLRTIENIVGDWVDKEWWALLLLVQQHNNLVADEINKQGLRKKVLDEGEKREENFNFLECLKICLLQAHQAKDDFILLKNISKYTEHLKKGNRLN